MADSEIHKKLQAIGDALVKGTYPLNPDNHDQVNIAIGLLNAESAEKMKQSMEELSGRITGMATTVSTTMERQVKQVIESNEKLARSNERSARILNWLTWTLVGIGVVQIVILLWQIFRAK